MAHGSTPHRKSFRPTTGNLFSQARPLERAELNIITQSFFTLCPFLASLLAGLLSHTHLALREITTGPFSAHVKIDCVQTLELFTLAGTLFFYFFHDGSGSGM